jgi:aspartate carbamoyltransferase catalytic subunit
VKLASPHLLGIEPLSPDEITLILDTAEGFSDIATREIKKVPTLRGKTVVNFFVEPSTRTRSSFELAEKRPSADSLNFSTSTRASSRARSPLDTLRNLEAIPTSSCCGTQPERRTSREARAHADREPGVVRTSIRRRPPLPRSAGTSGGSRASRSRRR